MAISNNQLFYIVVSISYALYITLRFFRRNGYWVCNRRAAERERQQLQRHADAVAAFMQQNFAVDGDAARPASSLAHNESPGQRKAFIMSCVVVDKAKNVLPRYINKDKTTEEFPVRLLKTKTSKSNESNPPITAHDGNKINHTSTNMNTESGDEEDQNLERDDGNDSDNGSNDTHAQNNNSNNNTNTNTTANDEKQDTSNPPFLSIFTQLIKDTMLRESPRSDNSEIDNTSTADNICPICIGEFEKDEDVCRSRNKNCPHVFHMDCMLEWLMNHDECPLCRQDYLSESDPLWVESSSSNNNNINDINSIGQSDGGRGEGGGETPARTHSSIESDSFRFHTRSNSI